MRPVELCKRPPVFPPFLRKHKCYCDQIKVQYLQIITIISDLFNGKLLYKPNAIDSIIAPHSSQILIHGRDV